MRGDLLAGLTFAAVNIPQGLAYAMMAGINPVNGLYTLMIGTPIAALFTGSVLMNVSSTSALSASMSDALSSFPSDQRLAAMGMLAAAMGIVMFVLGLLRLGWIMRFVPNSVMVGFISGVAINIVLGQIGDLTGYYSPYSNKIMQLADTLLHRADYVPEYMLIGLLTIALILLLEHTRLRSIAMLAALIITSLLALLPYFDEVPNVGSVADIPRALPQFYQLEWQYLWALIVPAISLSLLALVQGAAVGQSFPNPDGRYGSLNRDFAGQGLANVAIGLFQGLPAGGSASGTGVLVGAGARSRWANIFAGVWVVLITLLLGWAAELVAMPALAGLLIVIGFRMLNLPAIRTVWHTSNVARTSAVITFVSALLIPLQYAVLVGVAVAVLINVFQSADKVRLVQIVWSDELFPEEQDAPAVLPSDKITCLNVYGSLFFAAAATAEKRLPDASQARNTVVLLGLRGHQEVGSTLIGVLSRYANNLKAHDNRLILVGVEPHVVDQMKRTGLYSLLGSENVYPSEAQYGLPFARAYADAIVWMRARGIETHAPALLALQDGAPPSAPDPSAPAPSGPAPSDAE